MVGSAMLELVAAEWKHDFLKKSCMKHPTLEPTFIYMYVDDVHYAYILSRTVQPVPQPSSRFMAFPWNQWSASHEFLSVQDVLPYRSGRFVHGSHDDKAVCRDVWHGLVYMNLIQWSVAFGN